MCAIAGIIGLDFDVSCTSKMIATMRHRGPDDSGCESGAQWCLMHTRLTVIDPVGGKQPMTLQWGQETYCIVYNGELYNTSEIRLNLTKLGHTFLGHSDTEVVLHAYAQWGADCLKRMNGIFAFGVWEKNLKRLFLARDRMGVKPLFFVKRNSGLVFASEIKTILAYPKIRAELDMNGILEVLMLGPGRTPGSGVFRGIFELEPGQYGYFQKGCLEICQYWHLQDREHTESFDQTAEHVRFLVTDAIKRQMISDVPIGTFLSGGLDSSLISAVCAHEFAKDGRKLPTFSVDYEKNDQYFKPEKFQPNSDTAFIRIMQDQIDSDQHWTVLKPENLLNVLETATYARDLPGMADVDFSLLAFCGEIRKHVKVALSGECADEIFGGYPWYRDSEVLARNGFPWAQSTAQRARFLAKEIREKCDPNEFVMDRYSQTISKCDILPGNTERERKMKQMVNLNYRWFMQTLLDRKDRMSMYHGLEVRVPFCDYRIAEYLYSVPWEYKDYQGVEKGLLRYAMQDLLPQEIAWRKKSPYPKTHDPMYLHLVKTQLQEVLKQKDAPIFQLVDQISLRDLLDGNWHWPWYGQLMRIPQTIAFMLQINHWLERYKIQIV